MLPLNGALLVLSPRITTHLPVAAARAAARSALLRGALVVLNPRAVICLSVAAVTAATAVTVHPAGAHKVHIPRVVDRCLAAARANHSLWVRVARNLRAAVRPVGTQKDHIPLVAGRRLAAVTVDHLLGAPLVLSPQTAHGVPAAVVKAAPPLGAPTVLILEVKAMRP